MVKPQVIQDIPPRGIISAYAVAPYDEGREALDNKGYSEICLQENAQLRMQEGANANVSVNGNWVKEDAIYVPGKGKFLTKVSHISSNPKQATDCHRRGEDFYLTQEQVEQCLADSVLLSLKSVPTNKFGDNDITVYAFGNNAEKYGEFLREADISEMPIITADMQEKPFARKVWFRRLGGDWSDLNCGDRGWRGGYGRVRGVSRVSAEGASQKFSPVKTIDIEGILKYSKRFVPEYAQADFEKGLAGILNQ